MQVLRSWAPGRVAGMVPGFTKTAIVTGIAGSRKQDVPTWTAVAPATRYSRTSVADAMREKFGGDSLGEMKRNFDAWREQVARW